MAKSIRSQLSFLGKKKKLSRLKVDPVFARVLNEQEEYLDAVISSMDWHTESPIPLRMANKTLPAVAKALYLDGKASFDYAAKEYPDLIKFEGLYNYYFIIIFQICEVDIDIKGPIWTEQEVQKFDNDNPITILTKEFIIPELDKLIKQNKFGDDGCEYSGIPDPIQREKVENQVNLLLKELLETAVKNGILQQKDLDRITKKHYKLIQEEIDNLETEDRDRFFLLNHNLARFLNLKKQIE